VSTAQPSVATMMRWSNDGVGGFDSRWRSCGVGWAWPGLERLPLHAGLGLSAPTDYVLTSPTAAGAGPMEAPFCVDRRITGTIPRAVFEGAKPTVSRLPASSVRQVMGLLWSASLPPSQRSR